ncbi:MAG: dihydrodipicolinate synthase family protein [Gammaproteobacteria bacterium]|nr:dihydrodipicolinate synthase family protein [Gammaproteobacteria bacterium]
MQGVRTPLLTPFNDNLSIATDLFVAHAQRLLHEGCAGLVPFGTTGEALSVGIDERIAAVRALVDSGIDPDRLIPGTGVSNLVDTARLSRACLDMGCAAVMVLPPFYYKNVSDGGLFRYYAELIARIGSDARIYLYHIPPIAVVGVSVELAARLRAAFPGQIVGIKDSSGDWDNTRALLDIDGLVVFPGSELPLIEALERGAPGCISATANTNAAAIAAVIQAHSDAAPERAAALHAEVVRYRTLLLEQHEPIAAQKRLLALRSGDARWANVRPPLTPMAEEAGRELAAILRREFAVDFGQLVRM